MSSVQPPEAARAGQGLRFGEVAELYERRRPGYPPALFADVLAMVDPPRTVFEVGAGTGKATRQLLRAGAPVTAIEPDPEMAAVLRRELLDEGDLRVLHGTLEGVAGGPDRPVPPEGVGFAVVAAAQSWHWVDQARGPALARALLRPGGVLAAFWNTPVDGPDYARLVDVYRHQGLDAMADGMATGSWAAEMDQRRAVLGGAEGFSEPEVRRYRWAARYDPDGLAELVRTYSGHRLLDPPVLEALTAAVAAMVRAAGGTVELGYEAVLLTVRRVDGRS